MSARGVWVWMMVVLLIVGALGARMLNQDLLFTDEYLSMRNAGIADGPLSYAGVIERTTNEDLGGMGISYHLLLKAWGDATGQTAFGVRVYSWLFGLLTLVWLYRLGADMFGRKIGVYAAVLLGFCAFFINYTHEARAYTQLTMVTVMAVWLYWQIQKRENPSPLWMVALALSVAWLAYTHYIALAMGAVIGAYHLLNFRNERKWWMTLLALLVGGLLFLPWLGNTLIVVQRGLGETTRHASSMTAAQFVPQFFYVVASGNVLILLLLGWAGLTALHRVPFRRALSSPLMLVLLWMLVSGLLVIVINVRIPFMVNVRYLLFMFPAMALLGALGVAALAKRGLSANVALAAIAIVGGAQSINAGFIDGLFGQIYRAPAHGLYQAMDIVRQRADANTDILLLHLTPPSFEPFQLFPNAYLLHNVPIKRADQFELMNLSLKGDDNSYLQDSLPVFEGADTVWTAIVPTIPVTNRSGVVNYILSSQYLHCETVLDREDVKLDLYASNRLLTTPTITLSTPNGGTLGISTLRWQQANDGLHLLLGWSPDDLPTGQYSYSLRVVNRDGVEIASQDAGIPDQRPSSCTSNVFADLPQGDYRVMVYIYDWQTGDRLNETAVELGQYKVE